MCCISFLITQRYLFYLVFFLDGPTFEFKRNKKVTPSLLFQIPPAVPIFPPNFHLDPLQVPHPPPCSSFSPSLTTPILVLCQLLVTRPLSLLKSQKNKKTQGKGVGIYSQLELVILWLCDNSNNSTSRWAPTNNRLECPCLFNWDDIRRKREVYIGWHWQRNILSRGRAMVGSRGVKRPRLKKICKFWFKKKEVIYNFVGRLKEKSEMAEWPSNGVECIESLGSILLPAFSYWKSFFFLGPSNTSINKLSAMLEMNKIKWNWVVGHRFGNAKARVWISFWAYPPENLFF